MGREAHERMRRRKGGGGGKEQGKGQVKRKNERSEGLAGGEGHWVTVKGERQQGVSVGRGRGKQGAEGIDRLSRRSGKSP